MERIKFIDIAKVIGIYLVILGHYILYMGLDFKPCSMMDITHWIFMFHMPLFFILSGMLYRQRDSKTEWVKVKIQLLKPYLYMNLISIVICSIIVALTGDFSIKLFLRNILGIFTVGDFYGKAVLSYSGALWFCFSLACIKMLLSKTLMMKYKTLFVILFIAVSGGGMCIGRRLPFQINPSLVGSLFFMFGYFLRNIILRLDNISKYKLILIGIISASLLYYVGINNVDFSQRNVSIVRMSFGNNPIMFIVAGIAGTILICVISKLIEEVYCSYIRFIADGTIVILGFHHVVFFLFQGHIDSYNPIVAVSLSFVILLVCCGIIFLCKRYFPVLLGNRR